MVDASNVGVSRVESGAFDEAGYDHLTDINAIALQRFAEQADGLVLGRLADREPGSAPLRRGRIHVRVIKRKPAAGHEECTVLLLEIGESCLQRRDQAMHGDVEHGTQIVGARRLEVSGATNISVPMQHFDRPEARADVGD